MLAEITTQLDNPIWNALATDHSRFAVGNSLARQFLPEIGPLGGVAEQSAEAYEALAEVVLPGHAIAMFLEEPPASWPGWTPVHRDVLYQMIAEQEPGPVPAIDSIPLTADDVPQMLALAELTEPGPFRLRTIELGRFIGLYREGQLAAMSGERLALANHREISAVCTHPDHRGKGYGRALMSDGMQAILRRGETPFLHVRAGNTGAIALYETLGFRIRRSLYLEVLRNDTRPAAPGASEE